MPRDITPRRLRSTRQRFEEADERERLEAQAGHWRHTNTRCMQIAGLGFAIGLLLVAIGAQRSVVSAGASEAPVEVSLADLEDGAEAPKKMVDRDSVQGLIVNRIWRPDGKLREELQWRFPKLDLDDVLILQEGRTPSTESQSALVVAGGLLLSAVSALAFVFFLRRRPGRSRRGRSVFRR